MIYLYNIVSSTVTQFTSAAMAFGKSVPVDEGPVVTYVSVTYMTATGKSQILFIGSCDVLGRRQMLCPPAPPSLKNPQSFHIKFETNLHGAFRCGSRGYNRCYNYFVNI